MRRWIRRCCASAPYSLMWRARRSATKAYSSYRRRAMAEYGIAVHAYLQVTECPARSSLVAQRFHRIPVRSTVRGQVGSETCCEHHDQRRAGERSHVQPIDGVQLALDE